jgi:ATP-dependent Lon protease
MARIGLFPLDIVLVPTERVPLHIFEPRYKELVGECLEREEEFGIVLAKENGDVHHVGTRATVIEVLQVLPDGRMHVIVEGGDRFRLLEVDHERSFDTATVEELLDDDEAPDFDDVDRVFSTFKRLQTTVGAPGDPPDPSSPLFDFEVIGRVDFSAKTKQELLELTSPRTRIARLGVLLERALEALQIDQELRQRAHGNGKVTPPKAAES